MSAFKRASRDGGAGKQSERQQRRGSTRGLGGGLPQMKISRSSVPVPNMSEKGAGSWPATCAKLRTACCRLAAMRASLVFRFFASTAFSKYRRRRTSGITPGAGGRGRQAVRGRAGG